MVAAVSGVIAGAGLNIDRIDRLSGRMPLDENGSARVCVELSASGGLSSEASSSMTSVCTRGESMSHATSRRLRQPWLRDAQREQTPDEESMPERGTILHA